MSQTQTGGSATEQAKDTAQQATQQVKEAAQQGKQQARTQLRDQVDERSTQIGQQASTTADAIRQASSQLRENGQDGPARLIDSAAQRVEGVGSWLQNSDGDRILHDIEDLGRRQPLAVAAGGLAIGFALSRLLKASSRSRYETGYTGESRQIPAQTSPAGTGYEYGSGVAGSDLGTTRVGAGGSGVASPPPGSAGTYGGERVVAPASDEDESLRPAPGLGSPGAPVTPPDPATSPGATWPRT